LRILHVLAPAPFGGLERVVRDLSLAQRGIGHEVLVAAVGQEESDVRPFLGSLKAEDVKGEGILVPHRAYWQERRGVRDLCRRWKPNVLHTHGYRVDVVDGGLGRRWGLGPVTTVHGFTSVRHDSGDGGFSPRGLKNRFYEWLQCRVYRRFAAVVAVSEALRRDLRGRGVPEDRMRVVPNAIQEPEFLDREEARGRLGVQGAAFHIGWVGRLGPEKGPDVFLEALSRADIPDQWRVSIIGTGSMEEHLRRFSSGQGLDRSVRFLGPVEEAARLFRGLDLLVMSSRTEGTPIVLLEAMAAGIPIVSTAVGGIPYMLSEDEALLVHPEDPSALARALALAAQNPEASAQRARRARRRFERDYGAEDWARKYDWVYEEALTRGF
jgi:glycosyltransferase involved in cell wall biosynthesis